jgi:hypothetical protein
MALGYAIPNGKDILMHLGIWIKAFLSTVETRRLHVSTWMSEMGIFRQLASTGCGKRRFEKGQ